MNGVKLSPAQEAAADKAIAWWRQFRGTPGVFRLFGYAGTGKSTTAEEIVARVENEGGATVQVTPTGKAAKVLHDKTGRPTMTLHSLLYSFAGYDDEGDPIFVAKDPEMIALLERLRRGGLILLDECSMVPRYVMEDLLGLGVAVLAMGDPFQLPPVRAQAFFGDDCDVMLTEVHRQALDNPILRASMLVREHRVAEAKALLVRRKRAAVTFEMLQQADQVLCGTHATRNLVNAMFRDRLGHGKQPVVEGERIVALRNLKECDIWNGEVREVRAAVMLGGDMVRLWLRDANGQPCPIGKFRGDLRAIGHADYRQDEERAKECVPFDYGYALTVHKAQGSEWNRVALIDDWRGRMYERWLYTGMTRAREKLALIS